MTSSTLPELPDLLEDQLPSQEQFDALRTTLGRLRQELDLLTGTQIEETKPAAQKPSLFETAPAMLEDTPAPRAVVRTVIEPIPPKPDALLERATLEELNMALGLAFSQIANKGTW